jgi:hypothetical protein
LDQNENERIGDVLVVWDPARLCLDDDDGRKLVELQIKVVEEALRRAKEEEKGRSWKSCRLVVVAAIARADASMNMNASTPTNHTFRSVPYRESIAATYDTLL